MIQEKFNYWMEEFENNTINQFEKVMIILTSFSIRYIEKRSKTVARNVNKIINANHYHVGKVAITVGFVLISKGNRNRVGASWEKIGDRVAEKLDENKYIRKIN